MIAFVYIIINKLIINWLRSRYVLFRVLSGYKKYNTLSKFMSLYIIAYVTFFQIKKKNAKLLLPIYTKQHKTGAVI